MAAIHSHKGYQLLNINNCKELEGKTTEIDISLTSEDFQNRQAFFKYKGKKIIWLS